MAQPAGPGVDRGDGIRGGLLAALVLAVVARDRAVGGLGLDDLPVGRHQDARHEPERAEALRHRVGLNVAVVVLAGPDIAARPLERGGHHVVDQPVLVPDALLLERGLELLLVDLLEEVLEAPVIGLEDRVLGGQVHRPAEVEPVVQRGPREVEDRGVEVVHGHGHARARRVEDLALDHLAVRALEAEREPAGSGEAEIGRAVLVAIGVAAHDDGFRPAGDEPGDVAADDRLAEDHAAQDVADRAVGGLPHPLQPEFLDPRLVGGDRGAFDADPMLQDGLRGVDGDLVVRAVALLDPEVVVAQVDVEIGQDQLRPDDLPDDAGHLVAVELDDRVFDLDLRHGARPRLM